MSPKPTHSLNGRIRMRVCAQEAFFMLYQLRCLRVVHGRSTTAGAAAAAAAAAAADEDTAAAPARKRARTEGGDGGATGLDEAAMEVEAAAAAGKSSAAESLTDEECYALFRELNPKFVYLVRFFPRWVIKPDDLQT